MIGVASVAANVGLMPCVTHRGAVAVHFASSNSTRRQGVRLFTNHYLVPHSSYAVVADKLLTGVVAGSNCGSAHSFAIPIGCFLGGA